MRWWARSSRNRRLTPPVWVFPKLPVCLDCGFSGFTTPKENWQYLGEALRQLNLIRGEIERSLDFACNSSKLKDLARGQDLNLLFSRFCSGWGVSGPKQ
jgi:hypothetical protein